MRLQIVTCDVCGSDDQSVRDYAVRMPAMWPIGKAKDESVERFDLCVVHAKQAAEILAKGWEVTFREMLKNAEETGDANDDVEA